MHIKRDQMGRHTLIFYFVPARLWGPTGKASAQIGCGPCMHVGTKSQGLYSDGIWSLHLKSLVPACMWGPNLKAYTQIGFGPCMHVGTKSQSLYSDRIWSLHLSNGGLGLYNIKRFHPPGTARDKPDLFRTIQNFSPDVFLTPRNQTTSQTWHKLSEPPCMFQTQH